VLDRSWIAFVAVLFICCLSGCSGDQREGMTGSTEGRPARPATEGVAKAGVEGYDCLSLITGEEIDRIIGSSGTKLVSGVRGDKNEILAGETECGYEIPENRFLGVAVYTGSGFAEGLESFDTIWEDAEGRNAEEISGIGEKALMETDFAGGNQLLARVGGRGLKVGAGDFKTEESRELDEAVKKIAGTIASRLQER
jgi:hypothetical protein